MLPQLFWLLSIIASVAQVSMIIGAFINQGITPEVRFKNWTRKPFIRLAVSFFTGLGWGGVLAARRGLPPESMIVIALVSGVAFTLLMTALMRFLLEK